MKVRKKLFLYYKIPGSLLILIFALVRMQITENAPKIGIEIYMGAIAIFGLLIKSILAYIFPEIILDKEGLKIIERNKINWSAVKSMKIVKIDDDITVFIRKYNSKIISEKFKDLDISPAELKKSFKKFSPNLEIVEDGHTF